MSKLKKTTKPKIIFNINKQIDIWLGIKKNIEELVVLPPKKHFPWLTKNAILCVEKYINSKKEVKVLEFRGGSSTIYFARKKCIVDTIEHDKNWAKVLKDYLEKYKLNSKVAIKHIPEPYYSICKKYNKESFDIILVDGYAERFLCMKNSVRLLKPNGIIIFDDVNDEGNKEQIGVVVKKEKLYACVTTLKRKYGTFESLKLTNIYFKNSKLRKLFK